MIYVHTQINIYTNKKKEKEGEEGGESIYNLIKKIINDESANYIITQPLTYHLPCKTRYTENFFLFFVGEEVRVIFSVAATVSCFLYYYYLVIIRRHFRVTLFQIY